jgi:hypothetical protein
MVFNFKPDEIEIDSDRLNFLNSKNLIIGKKEVGKTNAALSIYNRIRGSIDNLFYFAGKEYEFEGIESYSSQDLPKLEQILEDIRQNNKLAKVMGETNHTCIILDDILFDKGYFFKEEYGKTIMLDGKSMGITLIVTMQYPMGVAPYFRQQFDHVMIGVEDFVSNKKRLYDHYGGMFPDFDTFNTTLGFGSRFEFLTTIHTSSKKIEDKVVSVKTEELEYETMIELLRDISMIDEIDEISNDQIRDMFDTIEISEVELVRSPNTLMIMPAGEKRDRALASVFNAIKCDVSKTYYFSKKKNKTPIEGIEYISSDDIPNRLKEILVERKVALKNAREKELECSDVCIVFDDMDKYIGDYQHDPALMDIIFNGRHRRITLITCISEPCCLKPEIRCNYDYIIIDPQYSLEIQRKVYDRYAGMFPSFDDYQSLCDDTDTDERILIVNRGRVSEISDRVKIVSFGYEINALHPIYLLSEPDEMSESDLLSDFDEFVKYLEPVDNKYDEMRLQKINEMQYITSMISYLNFRLNTLTDELKSL